MACCSRLTYRAKNIESLNRSVDNKELWVFVDSWIRRFQETDDSNVAEKLIYLWVTINAWASKSVPDLTKNHMDAYLVHCMAKDQVLSQRFDALYESIQEFQTSVNSFIEIGPVFQSLWLYNNNIPNWEANQNRSEFVKQVFEKDPFISVPDNKTGDIQKYPAFAPACADTHRQKDELIPADWPHVISMIYQVRCNLFHGGKNYNSDSDRKFIELAYKILWEVWKDELPSRVFPTDMPWHKILARSGFIFEQDEQTISFSKETAINRDYLQKIIDTGQFGIMEGEKFMPIKQNIDEMLWRSVVETFNNNAESDHSDDLQSIDIYMAGLIRCLNKIDIKATFSPYVNDNRKKSFRIRMPNLEDAHLAAWILKEYQKSFRQEGNELIFKDTIRPNRPNHQQEANFVYLGNITEWLYDNMLSLLEVVKTMRSISLPRPIVNSDRSPRHQ